MRIVYDDAKQTDLVKAVEDAMKSIDVRVFVTYSNGMNRVRMHKIKEWLNGRLAPLSLNIGNTVKHAHGIGNNCQYPVYYKPKGAEETQHCANINLNTGLYGEGYISIEDYNGSRVGPAYEIRAKWGVKKKR